MTLLKRNPPRLGEVDFFKFMDCPLIREFCPLNPSGIDKLSPESRRMSAQSEVVRSNAEEVIPKVIKAQLCPPKQPGCPRHTTHIFDKEPKYNKTKRHCV